MNLKMRLAAFLSRSGISSRREAERLIQEGHVRLNGDIVRDPARSVSNEDTVLFQNKRVKLTEEVRVWAYYKPVGLITTHKDPEGRMTVFEDLQKRYKLPRVVSVGRLDIQSEGLLLITNSSAFANKAETSKWPRKYRVRIQGKPHPDELNKLTKGVTLEGIRYAPIEIDYEPKEGSNQWLFMTLYEGKNREIRNLMEHVGVRVNRLIRVSYGPYELENLKPHEIKQVSHIV